MSHKVKQSLVNSRVDFFYYAFRNILLVGLPLTIISGLVLSHLSIHSSATGSGTDNFTVNISTACTISSTVNNEHFINANIGTYNSDIGKTTITTLCNDGNGYSIYANGFSNNEEGNNKLINSTYPQYSIDTGLATSGLTSQWAMKLNNIENDPSPTPPTIDSSYNDTYGLVPNTWTKVAYRQSGTTDMSEGSSFTTTYSVYASSSQYNGTYNGQVKYVLLHPYRNDSTITRTNLENAFALSGKSKINGYYAMQDMTSDICNSVTGDGESTATQLVDTRDNKLYYVTKLADGHCWMTQNLDFDINSNTILNSTTTDLNAIYNSSTGQYAEYDDGYTENNGIIHWAPTSNATTINFSGGNDTAIIGWQDSSTIPYTANKTGSTGTGHNSLGNYYNWTAAIASNNSSSLTQDTLSDISKNPQNSICPKGWRLPTISSESETIPGSTNEFTRLNYLYNSNQTTINTGLVASPVFLLYAQGRIYLNKLGLVDQTGLYFSSTNSSLDNNYRLVVRTTSPQVTPAQQANNGRQAGSSLRCIAR